MTEKLLTGTLSLNTTNQSDQTVYPHSLTRLCIQTVYPHSLISNFVCCFGSIIPIVAKPKVSSLSLVSVAEQTGLTWSHTTEDRFSRDEAQIKWVLTRAITLSLLNVSRVLGVVTFAAPKVIINVSNSYMMGLQLLDART